MVKRRPTAPTLAVLYDGDPTHGCLGCHGLSRQQVWYFGDYKRICWDCLQAGDVQACRDLIANKANRGGSVYKRSLSDNR